MSTETTAAKNATTSAEPLDARAEKARRAGHHLREAIRHAKGARDASVAMAHGVIVQAIGLLSTAELMQGNETLAVMHARDRQPEAVAAQERTAAAFERLAEEAKGETP